jgi:subtilisin family serine protease
MIRTVATALLLAALPATSAHAQDAVPGELLVRFESSAGGSERGLARRSAKVKAKREMRLRGAQLVATESGQSVRAAITALERSPHVLYAEPNWIFRATSTTPDDAEFGNLWGLDNIGQSIEGIFGLADKDIDAVEGWDIIKDAPSTVVAVADTGVRYDHPDLDGNIWSNPGETVNGADDGDPGALVDDVRGWDFIDGDNNPTDLQQHGTHVAGTIAAEGNNAFGITGVAWGAQIMPVRVLNEDGSGTYQAIADGFDYAGDMGAQVLNASLGGGGDGATGQFFADVIVQHPNTLYVVAAGNDANNNDTSARYPCNTPGANLICIAATDNKDALATFSNFGAAQVDLGAPGVGIRSTVPKVAQTGFADDFETGMDGWSSTGSTGGTWSLFTIPSYPSVFLGENPTDATYEFDNNENIIIATGAYNLAGKSGCVLAYSLYHDFDDGKDGLLVETSPNGSTWTARDQYTGNNGAVKSYQTNLKADGQSVLVRFRTLADNTIGAMPPGGWFGSLLDNVRVTCAAVPDATSFAFFNGTSMATPNVAGVATLLFGAKPAATVADVRGWLLNSGESIPSLLGKTVTGKRLNLQSALAAAGLTAPTPGAPRAWTGKVSAVGETTATLHGEVNATGKATTARFTYFKTASPATTSQTADIAVPSGATIIPVTSALTGLAAGTAYTYRLAATNADGTTTSTQKTFTTGSAPPAPPIPTPTVDPGTSGGGTGTPPAGTGTPSATGTPPPVSAKTPATKALTAKDLLSCKLSKRRKVTCKALLTKAATARILLTRGGKLVVRGSAKTLSKGQPVTMKTLRRAGRGRYKLQISLVERGVKTTLTRTITL